MCLYIELRKYLAGYNYIIYEYEFSNDLLIYN